MSYDEVIRFRKSAAKFVGDSGRRSILHQAMGLSRRLGRIVGWFDNLDLIASTPNGRRDTHVMVQEFQQHPSGILETGSAQTGSINLVIPCLLLSASRYLNIAREKNSVLIMPATVYMFGPLIDAPPSHPDIVLTSLLYMETSLGALGISCV